jgi:hypothetical protein
MLLAAFLLPSALQATESRLVTADASACGPQPFACNGGTFRGGLGANDCHSARGSFFDLYSFEAEPGELITATVAGQTFQGYVALVDPAGRIVTQHQARAGEKAFLAHQAAAGGIYDLITSSVETDALGGYDLDLGCLPIEPAPAGPCSAADGELCLGDGRFLVEAWWQTSDGSTGRGHGQRISEDSAFFWFFKEGMAEMMIKVVDGCANNDRTWVFTAGLTDVHTALRVSDTRTGDAWWSFNPQRTGFKTVQDTAALATCH